MSLCFGYCHRKIRTARCKLQTLTFHPLSKHRSLHSFLTKTHPSLSSHSMPKFTHDPSPSSLMNATCIFPDHHIRIPPAIPASLLHSLATRPLTPPSPNVSLTTSHFITSHITLHPISPADYNTHPGPPSEPPATPAISRTPI